MLINESPQKSKFKLKKDDLVNYKIFDTVPDIDQIPPENIPLEIIYENEDVLVINKQTGLSAHPTPNQTKQTLVNALLYHYSQVKDAVYEPGNPKSEIRAGIVHRLDKNTTGTMIVAKNSVALRSLSLQIKHRHAHKTYLGLCYGWLQPPKGVVNNFLGRDKYQRKLFSAVDKEKGKKAITNYEVVTYLSDNMGNHYSLVSFHLVTGRTHQIRSHCLYLGHPLIGDDMYFTPESKKCSMILGATRQLLHSSSLQITLPGENTPRTFVSDMPKDFSDILSKLHSKS